EVPVSWVDRAACADENPDLFFPRRGEAATQARRICAGCPVRVECPEHAREEGMRFGVWGGTTPPERQGMPRPKKLRAIVHGTEGGYRTHLRRGERPCAECRAASAVASRERRDG